MDKGTVFPIYTSLTPEPRTYCEALDARVFDWPFFNEGQGQLRKDRAERGAGSLEELPDLPESGLLDLKGFIFNTAHCGSTLLARMLGQSPRVRVVRETEAINGLLLAYRFYDLPLEVVLPHLKRVIEAYRLPLRGERYLLFKLSSWNVFFIELFQQLYPEMPWIYMDRDQEAVVRSLLKSGYGFVEWWHHPVDILRKHFVSPGRVHTDQEAYISDVVERHRLHAHLHKNERAYFIQYPDFIQQFEAITKHFQLHFEADEWHLAHQMTAYDAKSWEAKPYKSSGAEPD